jgi:hypothetical protein
MSHGTVGIVSAMENIYLPHMLAADKAHQPKKIILVGNFDSAGQKIRRKQGPFCSVSLWTSDD